MTLFIGLIIGMVVVSVVLGVIMPPPGMIVKEYRVISMDITRDE